MDTPTEAEIDSLLATHGPKRPPAYAALHPCLNLVRALRQRQASFETVREILRARGVEASESTIRNFCRDVLGESPALRRPELRKPRRRLEPPPPPEPASEPSPAPSPTPPPAPDPRARGPRIANLKRNQPDAT